MKSIAIKSLATLAVAGLVLSSFAAALSVQAATTTTTTTTFATDLTLGSTGADVTALQNWLIGKGFSIPAGATGYFGAQTKAALAAYQTSAGITPAAGYFGPITRAKVNAGGSTTTTTTDMSGTGEGYLDEFDLLSKYSSEQVGEGDEDVEVLGFETEAKDADQKIERLNVTISTDSASGNAGYTTSSDDLEDYVSEVSVLLDGKVLDTMSVDDASHTKSSDTYTFRFTGLNGVIKEGEVGEVTLAVTAVDNLDSTDLGADWTAEFVQDGLRAVSPNGVDDTFIDGSDDFVEEFEITSFATANDLELKASLGDDNLESTTVEVDSTSDTNDVELLQFSLKAQGSDMNVDELPIFLTATGANVGEVANKLTLKVNGDEFTKSVSAAATTATITFDDLDLDIDEGDTLDFTVTADINDLESPFTAGDTLKAELTAYAVTQIDATDATDEDITDFSGSALGNAMSFYETGLIAEFVSSDETATSNTTAGTNTGTFTIKYKVSAFGGDVYVSTTAVATETAVTVLPSAGVYYQVDKSGTATAGATGVVTVTKASGSVTSVSGGYKITEGSTADVTLTVTHSNYTTANNGLYRAAIKGISWGTTDATGTNLYNFDLEDYKTDYVSVN